MYPKKFIVLIVFATCAPSGFCWTYNGTEGPEEWPDMFPSCGGRMQSPVDVQTNLAVGVNVPYINFSHYDTIVLASLLENGHTVVLNLPSDYPDSERPTITAGGLGGEYVFQQLHFHWGDDDTHGSEHTVNNIPYSAELHMVHYNAKYGSYNNATAYPDGLAVLGIFLQASEEDNPAFDPIIKHLREVTHEGDEAIISEPLNFNDILPITTSLFYRYFGSLTTPTCDEIVTWTLFATPSALSSKQLSEFRQLTNAEGLPLVNNDRPIQALNDRTIYRSL